MATIITREVGATAKGSPLSNAELDNNFISLNSDKLEKYTWVKNTTGSTVTPGTVVYITGSTGENVTIGLASAGSEAASSKTFAVIVDTINNNAVGRALREDYITGLNTSTLTEGAALWLSPIAGQYTTTKPAAPNHTVFLGYVVRSHASDGVILVKVQNGYELDELHDVQISNKIDGQTLQYEASTQLWKNKDLPIASTSSKGVASFDGSQFAVSPSGVVSITGNVGTATSLTVSATPPVDPVDGDAWLDTTSGITYNYINDGNSTQWVELTSNISISNGSAVQAPETAYSNQYKLFGTTNSSTETELFVDGLSGTRIPVAANTTVYYTVELVCRRTDSSGTHGAWFIKGVATNLNGTVSDIGALYEVIVVNTDPSIAVDVRADDTNNSIGLFVTGAAGKTISWKAAVNTVEV